MSERVTEKIQVLISSDDMNDLNRILLLDAFEKQSMPMSLSKFVRELIIEYLEENRHRLIQKSIVKEDLKKLKQTD